MLFKCWSVVITAIPLLETCTNIYFSQRNVYLLGARKNAVIKERFNSYSSLKERKKILDPN